MSDQYDEAVKYLSEHPERMNEAWGQPHAAPGGILFRYATETGYRDASYAYRGCGCLTQVRAGFFDACTWELTEAIRADERIPKDVSDITRENLPVFAEWQRKIDAVFAGRSEGAASPSDGKASGEA